MYLVKSVKNKSIVFLEKNIENNQNQAIPENNPKKEESELFPINVN
jgi:hypothetical protein